ncbi:MAG TPA: M1 family aminopeptidase [Candidatus Binatia bacterium]|nr:M1 family aminopeptidase [Candidatus Binatia bacterium]
MNFSTAVAGGGPFHARDGRNAGAAGRRSWPAWLALLFLLCAALPGRADRPLAPSREYDLQHSTLRLSFDTADRKVIGDVEHRVSMLHDAATRIVFDCAALEVESVMLDGHPAKYELAAEQLAVLLPAPARSGDAHTVEIRYQGHPRQGMFFILPDKNYPQRPTEIWTQGEAEDTRFYLPTYDYPNDRLTTDTYLTVPAGWETISNGRLEGKTADANGRVTWHWAQHEPVSTYLISVVAGEFDHLEDTRTAPPLSYYTPRGEGDRIPPTFGRTRAMVDFFSSTFGVPYPWNKYAQVAVNEFTEDGMENTSATTLSARALIHPALAAEEPEGEDDLISHELAHQWFGDLVTCQDWTNLWLNEGFATVAEYIWEEHAFGRDSADFRRWRDARDWFLSERLFQVPIVTSNFTDSMEYSGNTYNKAGLVLYMLREQMGAVEFYAGLKHYLEKYRYQNVTTADLQHALEESSGQKLDAFFRQWLYGAGAPQLAMRYTFDSAARQVRLEVRQTQKMEGAVGLFTLHAQVEIATAAGTRRFPIVISKLSEAFSFPAETAPWMVLFDPGDTLLVATDFQKPVAEWIYQLRKGSSASDRADAASVLGGIREQPAVFNALAETARGDLFWGVRSEALQALARLGGPAARDALLAAMEDPDPRVAETAAIDLGEFPHDAAVANRLEAAARNAKFFRQREAALLSLGRLQSGNAFRVLLDAAHTDSPDDVLRRAAFRGFESLGDAHATPVVLEWAAPGRPLLARSAAIRALGRLDTDNRSLTNQLLADLREPIGQVRTAALSALSERRDPAAIAPLAELISHGEFNGDTQRYAQRVLERLRKAQADAAAAASPGGAE